MRSSVGPELAGALMRALVAEDFADLWLYLVGPSFGAALGALSYRWVGACPTVSPAQISTDAQGDGRHLEPMESSRRAADLEGEHA